MTREFINADIFDKNWNKLGLTDDDLKDFQEYLLQNPSAGDIIEGTGGAAKVRFALEGNNKGKSGGIRVIYADITHKNQIGLILCYSKGKQDNLTTQQKKQLKELVKTMKGE